MKTFKVVTERYIRVVGSKQTQLVKLSENSY